MTKINSNETTATYSLKTLYLNWTNQNQGGDGWNLQRRLEGEGSAFHLWNRSGMTGHNLDSVTGGKSTCGKTPSFGVRRLLTNAYRIPRHAVATFRQFHLLPKISKTSLVRHLGFSLRKKSFPGIVNLVSEICCQGKREREISDTFGKIPGCQTLSSRQAHPLKCQTPITIGGKLSSTCYRLGFSKHKMIIVVLLAMSVACSEGPVSERPIPEVSSEKVEIVRFDQMLCPANDTARMVDIDRLLAEYPIFTDVFFNQVIFPQNTSSIKLENLIQNYCSSPAIQHLIDTVQILYPGLRGLENNLGQAFGYFHYYFPDKPIPRVFTYVSEFGIGTFTVDTRVLGIGLDFFLGTDYTYYDPAVFPRYMQQTMTPDYISANAIRALAQVLISPVTSGNLLDYMIHNGKVLYLTSRFLPESPMYEICLYTPDQMEWVENNELNIWSYLIDLGYFYESDQRKFKKFIDPSPNTPGMPEQAPGRVANWIGYKIIEAYMNRHPDISFPELAKNTDFQGIMDRSKYKPERPG